MGEKLFAVYLGGRADGCNIELHDVVFVVGPSIEATYSLLAKKWFGNLQGFHIDSYVELQNIDGYKIENLAEGNKPNNYGTYVGSMSNHDKVYDNLIEVLQNNASITTNSFEGLKTVEIIDKIYTAAIRL